MKTYVEHIGAEEYEKQEREFFRAETVKNRPEENWYYLREDSELRDYWQMCLNEQEKTFREQEGYKLMFFKSQRTWLYNDPNTLKMFDGADKGYK